MSQRSRQYTRSADPMVAAASMPRCRHSGKLRYPTQRAAVAAGTERGRLLARDETRPTGTYPCGRCGGWHLTSAPNPEFPLRG